MADYKYNQGHAWALIEGGTAKFGITPYAAEQLGDIVYVDLPTVGDTVSAGDTFTEVESSKTSSEVPAPLSGEIIAVNEELDDDPENINEDAYANWIIEIKLDDPSEADALLDADAYDEICE